MNNRGDLNTEQQNPRSSDIDSKNVREILSAINNEAISDVKKDLSSGIPMDRLICGDVGFGKTEVAMRASFLMVSSGKQVVIVVPTTLLAKQHLDTFKKRFDSYPVEIEMLSRLTPKKKAADILENVSLGSIDILIGTL